MEDKDKKKNVKKIIVYAVLLVLIMGIALGTGQIQTEELGRFGRVQERFRDALRRRRVRAGRIRWKADIERNGSIRPTGRARKENF